MADPYEEYRHLIWGTGPYAPADPNDGPTVPDAAAPQDQNASFDPSNLPPLNVGILGRITPPDAAIQDQSAAFLDPSALQQSTKIGILGPVQTGTTQNAGANALWWDPRRYLPDYGKAWQMGIDERRKVHGHNDLGDAMRHAEWSRDMASQIGPFTAWSAGLGHEIAGWLERQPWDEGLMDLHNNLEGRRAAAEGRPINPANLRTFPGQRGGAY